MMAWTIEARHRVFSTDTVNGIMSVPGNIVASKTWGHRTAKAAARRLASLINNPDKYGLRAFNGFRAIAPDGEIMPLRELQRRIKEGKAT